MFDYRALYEIQLQVSVYFFRVVQLRLGFSSFLVWSPMYLIDIHEDFMTSFFKYSKFDKFDNLKYV